MTDEKTAEGQSPSTTEGELTDEDLKKEFERLAGEIGQKPTKEDMDRKGEFGSKTYETHFGSWNSAVLESGYDPRRWGSNVEIGWEAHDDWVNTLINDSISTLLRSFGEVEGFGSIDGKTLAEATLNYFKQFVDKEGSDFMKSPQYANESASEPERWALAASLAGSLLSVSRQQDLPIRVDEISSVICFHTGFDIDDKLISKFKRRVDGAAGEWVSPPPVEQFLKRYADQMSVHPDTLTEALSIVDDLDGNMDPNVAASTALWLASRQTGEPMRRKTLLELANVSGPAIRKSIPEKYDYEKKIIRFGRKIGEDQKITIPKVIVDWLGLDGKYVLWPDLDDLTPEPEEVDPIQSLPITVASLDVMDDSPESTHSKIVRSEYKDGVWEITVPSEYLPHLPKKVLLSWRWDWDQNTGQLILQK